MNLLLVFSPGEWLLPQEPWRQPVNNEQTPYRMSCPVMAPDRILARTCPKPRGIHPPSVEPLASTSLSSLAQMGAQRESRCGLFKKVMEEFLLWLGR